MSQHHLIAFWQGRTENAYREMILAKQENELLKAENERLRKADSDNTEWKLIGLCAEATEKINELKAENERLRKIGDELADVCGWVCLNPIDGLRLIDKWQSAKGVQS